MWRVAGHASVVLPDEYAASILSPIALPVAAAPLTAFRVVCAGARAEGG